MNKGEHLPKKLALVLLMETVFLLTPSAFSYTVITDSNLFYSFYEEPKVIIDFTELRDGTSYEPVADIFKLNSFYLPKPECLTDDGYSAGEFGTLTVRPDSFSKAWSFMGAVPEEPASFCEAVIWFDQGISTGTKYKMAVVATSGQSQPFAMYTNKGFIAVLPDTGGETIFIFNDIYRVFSFESGFIKFAPVLETKDLLWGQFK